MTERQGRWSVDSDVLHDAQAGVPMTDRDMRDLEELIRRVRVIRDARG